MRRALVALLLLWTFAASAQGFPPSRVFGFRSGFQFLASLGPNLISLSNFTLTTGWTYASNQLSYTTASGSTAISTSNTIFTSGQTYKISITYSTSNASTLQFYVYPGAQLIVASTPAANTTYTYTFTATATGPMQLQPFSWNGTITALSVQQVL